MTKTSFAITAFFLAVLAAAPTAEAAPCLIVTLTGTRRPASLQWARRRRNAGALRRRRQ